MSKTFIIIILINLPFLVDAQKYNPFVNNGAVDPSPLSTVEAGGKGVLSFTIGNTGLDTLNIFGASTLKVTIDLKNGEPDNADPVSALGGSFLSKFSWTYGGSAYTGTQTGMILPGSSGSITINYKVTKNTPPSKPENGCSVNLGIGPYNDGNTRGDDQLNVYTYTECPPPPAPVIGTVTQPSCEVSTGSVEVSGLPATSWTLTREPGNVSSTGTGATTRVTGIGPGSYTFTVTNAAGCTSAKSSPFTVDQGTSVPAAPGTGTRTQPTCTVPTGSVILTGLPSPGTWTITQSTGGKTYTASGSSYTVGDLSPGTYTFTVTIGGCTSLSSADVVINSQPTVPGAPVVGTVTQPTCDEPTGSVVLTGLPSSGTWTLTRNPGGSITGTGATVTISALASGTYTFTVTLGGCTSVPSGNVVIIQHASKPSAPVIGVRTQPTCAAATGSVNLTGLPSGEWTITQVQGSKTYTGSVTSYTVTGLSAGTYNFTVTNSGGCTSPSSGDVVINPQPTVPDPPVAGTVTQPTCDEPTGSVVLTGLPSSGTWTLTRNPGGSITGTGATVTISALAPGTYTFTVTLGGCTSVPSGNVVIIQHASKPSAPVIGVRTQPTCTVATGSVNLTGLPSPGTWTLTRTPGTSISTGSGTSVTVTGLDPGTYTFTVTSQGGCTSDASAGAVINAQPVPPSPPVPGTITQPTCTSLTGSVVMTGLPSSGTWTLTRNPGGTTRTGTGSSVTITGLGPDTYTFTVSVTGCTSGASANVLINPPPVTPSAPVPGTVTQPTCDVATGSIILNGLPATGNWTLTRHPDGFKINGTGITFTDSGLSQNNYSYTVTNAAGCTSSSSSDVTIQDSPAIREPVTQRVSCLLGAGHAIITVQNPVARGMEYRLDNGNFQGSNIFNDVPNGTHTITVRNSSGCTAAGQPFPVSCGCVNGPSLILGSTTGTVCGNVPITVSGNSFNGNATSVTITGNGAGSVLPATVSVSPFSFTYTPAPADAGKAVIITVTTNNPVGPPCVPATATYTLNVGIVPSAPSSGNIVQPTCTLPTGSITLSSLPSGNWTVSRMPGASSTSGSGQSITLTGIESGTYTFTVTNASGCTSAASPPMIINAQPVIPAAPVPGNIIQPTCITATGAVDLTGLPATGTWTIVRYPGTVSTTGSGTSTTITGLAPGTYNFTVTNLAGCTSPLSSNIVINAQPPTPAVPVSGEITGPTCITPGSAVLNGLPQSGAWTINSIPAGITQAGTGISAIISNLPTGSYVFTVTNSFGCTSVASASVIVPKIPDAPVLSITNPAPVCTPSTTDITDPAITAGSTGGLTYTYWTDAAATAAYATPSAATGGTYYIKGTNASQCTDIEPVTVIIKDKPFADAGTDQDLQFVFESLLSANEPATGETGMWTVFTGTGTFGNPGSARTKVTGLSVGKNVFIWTVTNNVCRPAIDSAIIFVHDLTVPTLITPNEDGKNDYFFLEGLEELAGNQLSIFDRRGALVYRNDNYKNTWNGVDYNGRNLPDDTYFYVLRTGNGRSRAGYIVIRR